MQVPLLSLIQIPNLNIKNAEVDFQAETAVLEDKEKQKKHCCQDLLTTDKKN